jgi:hypothetical protein
MPTISDLNKSVKAKTQTRPKSPPRSFIHIRCACGGSVKLSTHAMIARGKVDPRRFIGHMADLGYVMEPGKVTDCLISPFDAGSKEAGDILSAHTFHSIRGWQGPSDFIGGCA